MSVLRVVRVDKRSRLLIPAELRRKIGVEAGDTVIVQAHEDGSLTVVKGERH